jgi:hypothetical protein
VRFCVRIAVQFGVRFVAKGVPKVNFLFFLLKCVARLDHFNGCQMKNWIPMRGLHANRA